MKGDCRLGKLYKTISGDEWDVICYKHYGTEVVMDQVMNANPKHIQTVVFSAGIELILPEIDTIKESANKPPWMR